MQNLNTLSTYDAKIITTNTINNLPPTITNYEPVEQDLKQVSLLHSSTKISSITYDGAYFNSYKRDNQLDERYGLFLET